MTAPSVRLEDDGPRMLLAVVSFVASGVFFVAFPAVRPFGDSSSDPMTIAQTFASTAWVVAHSFGIIGFVLLPVGVYGVHLALQGSPVGRRAFFGFLLVWIGSSLTVVFFGLEAFGLQVIGQQALARGSSDALAVANDARYGPGLGFILVGLLLVAAGAVLIATAVWGSGTLPRWSALPFGLGLVLYIPQLAIWASIQSIRVADAVLIAAGAFGMAAGLWRQSRRTSRPR